MALVLAVSACEGDGHASVTDAAKVLRADTDLTASVSRPWKTLRDVLPNVTYSYDTPGQQPAMERVTDSVVMGRVIRTEPARGMLGEPLTAGEDVRTRVVAFDDPRAAWRVLSVTFQVTETLGGSPADELLLDWYMGPARGGTDVRTVEQALKDLGSIVVLSKAFPDAPEFVPGRGPLPAGYGIGRVADDGSLDFPLVDADDSPRSRIFQDGIDTLDELRAEARKPARTVEAVPTVYG
jgi:hypothetical protein